MKKLKLILLIFVTLGTIGGCGIRKLLYIHFLIIIFLIASCTSNKTIHPYPANIQSEIQPGDKIKIVTKDNQEVEFEVIEVNDEYIIGENIKVPITDITDIEEETASGGEETLLISIFTFSLAGYLALGVLGAPYGGSKYEALSDTLGSTAEQAGELLIFTGTSYEYHPDFYTYKERTIEEEICAQECDKNHNCNNRVSNTDNTMQQYYGRASYGRAKLEGMELCHPLESCIRKCYNENNQ